MRRKHGIGIKPKANASSGTSNIINEVKKEKEKSLLLQMEQFTKNLEAFAIQYKDEIKYNPAFRQEFYTMCVELGVDPLASISLWSKNLNLNEFYYNLAIQIITLAMTHGPLIEINELRKILILNNKAKKNEDITLLDIEKAIESVSDLKCGFQIVKIKNSKVVVTVPMEKTESMDGIIELASENGGWVGYSLCYNKKGMTKIQFEDAIGRLIEHGVCWSDDQHFIKEETKNDDVIYWFPGIINN
jgi:ESCRT-II complex subunit VPS22